MTAMRIPTVQDPPRDHGHGRHDDIARAHARVLSPRDHGVLARGAQHPDEIALAGRGVDEGEVRVIVAIAVATGVGVEVEVEIAVVGGDKMMHSVYYGRGSSSCTGTARVVHNLFRVLAKRTSRALMAVGDKMPMDEAQHSVSCL